MIRMFNDDIVRYYLYIIILPYLCLERHWSSYSKITSTSFWTVSVVAEESTSGEKVSLALSLLNTTVCNEDLRACICLRMPLSPKLLFYTYACKCTLCLYSTSANRADAHTNREMVLHMYYYVIYKYILIVIMHYIYIKHKYKA